VLLSAQFSKKERQLTQIMKKRIFTALLAVLMLALMVVPCFATSQQPAETEEAQELTPEQKAALEEALKAQAAQQQAALKPGDIVFTAKNAEYDEAAKVISFTLANTSKQEAYISTVEFVPDKEKINIQYGGLQYGSLLAAGAETEFKINAEIPGYDAENIPTFGLNITYIPRMTEVDLTVEQEQYMAKIENIFAPVATPAEAVMNFLDQTGFMALARNWKMIVMLLISFVLMYLAIVKKFEPLLLLPIAFGMMLTNLPGADMFHEELFADGHVHWELFNASNAITPGLIDILYLGVKLGIYPCLIFLGVGAMTDFGPLIANPKSLLLGAAAQLGIFMTYVAASSLFGFNPAESGSIGIIGGADGPTAIFVTSKLAPHLLGPIAVAAYSYMALVPVIQPPIMKLLTTKKERQIVMKPLREVSKTEKIVFPIAITVFVTLLVPSAGPLVGCLMLGNLARECGVVDRISKTAQNELMNIVTIFLGISVGATATAGTFLQIRTLAIIAMGVVAFGCGTAGGVLLAKLMNLFLKKNKINPLIGSAGVSAVPMAARVSQVVGQKENPQNFLLMHAMGPNVAGVIGSAIAAGVLIALFG